MGRLRIGYQVGSRLEGGTARYAHELARALAAEGSVDLVPIGTAPVLDSLHESIGSPTDRIEVPSGQLAEAATIRFRLGRLLRGRADVFHGTKHLVPRRPGMPTVLTVQDVLPLDEPGGYPFAKRMLLPRHYRASLREASILVVASQATAKRLADQLPDVTPRATILRTAPALSVVAAEARPLADAPEVFGLYVGDLSPRKNLPFLLELWPEVHVRTGCPLLLAGPDGWRSRPVVERIAELERSAIVRRLGFVDDGTLRWLYEHAAVVTLPSRYEGTGLPVLEALALGTPVVASDEPALVEYGNGRPVHVSLDDRAGWIEALVEGVDRPRASPSESPVFPRLDSKRWVDAQLAIYRQLVA